MKIQRTLNLSISLDEDEIEVTVSEPESGESKHFRNFAFCPDEHPAFNEIIGEEIYSWISLWTDEADEEGKAVARKTANPQDFQSFCNTFPRCKSCPFEDSMEPCIDLWAKDKSELGECDSFGEFCHKHEFCNGCFLDTVHDEKCLQTWKRLWGRQGCLAAKNATPEKAPEPKPCDPSETVKTAWMRLGVSIPLAESEAKEVLAGTRKGGLIIQDKFRKGLCKLDGESYIPEPNEPPLPGEWGAYAEQGWDFPLSRTDGNNDPELIELCTFPEYDDHYCRCFSVPKAWLLRKSLFLQNSEEGLAQFLEEYVWEDTYSLYLLARSEGVIFSEEDQD